MENTQQNIKVQLGNFDDEQKETFEGKNYNEEISP